MDDKTLSLLDCLMVFSRYNPGMYRFMVEQITGGLDKQLILGLLPGMRKDTEQLLSKFRAGEGKVTPGIGHQLAELSRQVEEMEAGA